MPRRGWTGAPHCILESMADMFPVIIDAGSHRRREIGRASIRPQEVGRQMLIIAGPFNGLERRG